MSWEGSECNRFDSCNKKRFEKVCINTEGSVVETYVLYNYLRT